MRLLRKQVRISQFRGCPLSRIVSALPEDQTALRDAGRNVFHHCANTLTQIHAELRESLPQADPPAAIGERFMLLSEGAAQMYTLTGAISAFELLESELKKTA